MSATRPFLLAAALLPTAACSAVLTPAATNYPVTAEVNFSQLAGMKRGESCAKTILWLFGPERAGRDPTHARAGQHGGLGRVEIPGPHESDPRLRHRPEAGDPGGE